MTRYCIVGIDGSPEGDAALRFGLEEARLRGIMLRVVCAWEASAGSYVGEAFTPTADVYLEAPCPVVIVPVAPPADNAPR